MISCSLVDLKTKEKDMFEITIHDWTLKVNKEDEKVRIQIFVGGERVFNDLMTIEEIEAQFTAEVL